MNVLLKNVLIGIVAVILLLLFAKIRIYILQKKIDLIQSENE